MHRLLPILAAAGTTLVGPSALLPDEAPGGFERAPEAAVDLSFEEYAPLAPDAIAHVDPSSREAADMTAAVDVWTSAESDILLREVTLWGDDGAAEAFVEQAAVLGAEQGLAAVESFIVGGVEFVGQDGGLWTRTQTWRQGPYAVTVSHFSVEAGSDAAIASTVRAIVRTIRERTGHDVAERSVDGGIDEAEPGGGLSIFTVLLFVLAIGGAVWFVLRFRRRTAAGDEPTHDDGSDTAEDDAHELDDLDVDDIIERARARRRAEREIDAIPDPGADRTPPSDF